MTERLNDPLTVTKFTENLSAVDSKVEERCPRISDNKELEQDKWAEILLVKKPDLFALHGVDSEICTGTALDYERSLSCCVMDTSKKGAPIVRVSKAFEQDIGYSRDFILGRPIFFVKPWNLEEQKQLNGEELDRWQAFCSEDRNDPFEVFLLLLVARSGLPFWSLVRLWRVKVERTRYVLAIFFRLDISSDILISQASCIGQIRHRLRDVHSNDLTDLALAAQIRAAVVPWIKQQQASLPAFPLKEILPAFPEKLSPRSNQQGPKSAREMRIMLQDKPLDVPALGLDLGSPANLPLVLFGALRAGVRHIHISGAGKTFMQALRCASRDRLLDPANGLFISTRARPSEVTARLRELCPALHPNPVDLVLLDVTRCLSTEAILEAWSIFEGTGNTVRAVGMVGGDPTLLRSVLQLVRRPPVVVGFDNPIEFPPNPQTLGLCHTHGIVPLGLHCFGKKANLVEMPGVIQIAHKHSVDTEVLLGHWLVKYRSLATVAPFWTNSQRGAPLAERKPGTVKKTEIEPADTLSDQWHSLSLDSDDTQRLSFLARHLGRAQNSTSQTGMLEMPPSPRARPVTPWTAFDLANHLQRRLGEESRNQKVQGSARKNPNPSSVRRIPDPSREANMEGRGNLSHIGLKQEGYRNVDSGQIWKNFFGSKGNAQPSMATVGGVASGV